MLIAKLTVLADAGQGTGLSAIGIESTSKLNEKSRPSQGGFLVSSSQSHIKRPLQPEQKNAARLSSRRSKIKASEDQKR
jgi:hypothetical protein